MSLFEEYPEIWEKAVKNHMELTICEVIDIQLNKLVAEGNRIDLLFIPLVIRFVFITTSLLSLKC